MVSATAAIRSTRRASGRSSALRFESPFDPWALHRLFPSERRHRAQRGRSRPVDHVLPQHQREGRPLRAGRRGGRQRDDRLRVSRPRRQRRRDGSSTSRSSTRPTPTSSTPETPPSAGPAGRPPGRRPAGGTSPRYDTVSTSAYGPSTAPALAVDASGRPHVAWARPDGSARPEPLLPHLAGELGRGDEPERDHRDRDPAPGRSTPASTGATASSTSSTRTTPAPTTPPPRPTATATSATRRAAATRPCSPRSP